MNFHKKTLLIFLCGILLLSACNDDKKEKTDIKKTDSTAEVQLKSPELPKTIEEVINYPVGPFGTDEHKEIDEAVKKELDKIPTLPKDAGEQELNELFAYLYSLFKMEYQDPREALTAYDITEKGNTETNTSNQQGSFNVEIILDSSGSMGNKMGGKTRMELAKESIQKFAASLPKEANVSLRVYGHKGTGSDKDKTKSCASNELVYSPQPYDKTKMDEALKQFKPAGWTPLADAILKAQEDLSAYKGDQHKNIVYVVSDGIETCGGDPVAAAKSLKESGISPIVHVIGFDVKSKDQKQLEEIAKAAGGIYTNVRNQKQLQNEFGKSLENLREWSKWQNEEIGRAYSKSNEVVGDIYQVVDNWTANIYGERNQISGVISRLYLNKKITSEQEKQLKDIAKNYYDGTREKMKELRETKKKKEKKQ